MEFVCQNEKPQDPTTSTKNYKNMIKCVSKSLQLHTSCSQLLQACHAVSHRAHESRHTDFLEACTPSGMSAAKLGVDESGLIAALGWKRHSTACWTSASKQICAKPFSSLQWKTRKTARFKTVKLSVLQLNTWTRLAALAPAQMQTGVQTSEGVLISAPSMHRIPKVSYLGNRQKYTGCLPRTCWERKREKERERGIWQMHACAQLLRKWYWLMKWLRSVWSFSYCFASIRLHLCSRHNF